MPQSQLAQLCTDENKVRENYFSDTYRCTFSLNGTLRDWDITHVSIPFAPDKEHDFMERFGVRKGAMTEYYEHLAERLPYEAKLLDTIHTRGGEFEALAGNLIRFLYIESIPKEGRGSDLYYVSEPMDPLVGSDFIHHDVISLLNLLQLGARFTQMLKVTLGTGLHIGAFDLDTIYLTRPESGRPMIKLGSLLYAALDGKPPPPLPESLPPSVGEDVRQGGRQSVITDTDALCGLLWTLANGSHYTMPPDYETAPRYAPDGLTEALVRALEAEAENGEETLKELHNTLFRMIRQIRKGEMDDLIIPLEPPVHPGVPAEEPAQIEAETVAAVPQAESANPDSVCISEPVDSVPPPESPAPPDTADSGAVFTETEQPEEEKEDVPVEPVAQLPSGALRIARDEELRDAEQDVATVYMGGFVLEDLETVVLPDNTEIIPQTAEKESESKQSVVPILLYLMLLLMLILFALEFFRMIEPYEIPLIHDLAETVRQLLAG